VNRVASSPLAALVDYYHRLEKDPNQEVAKFGYSRQKISFVVVIDLDGSLHAIQDARRESGGKQVPDSMLVPGQSKPSGQGINPCFLWDNGRYMLGCRPDDDDPARTTACFAAFRDMHLGREDEVGDQSFSAVCRFLQRWDPQNAADQPLLLEVGRGFGVFRIRSDDRYVHTRPRVMEYWNKQILAPSIAGEVTGTSLVTGSAEPIARLHEPKIKGVVGAQSSGAVLVGFNDSAYESYGKSQSYNAPIGVRDAFRYTTALNHLLADGARRVRIGDATVVFWTDREEAKGAEEVFAALFGESTAAVEAGESGRTVDRLRAFLAAARQGHLADQVSDPEAPFYVLGLSPNASRVNVRFWLAGTVAQFVERLSRHEQDLDMTGARPGGPPLMIRRLLLETAREPKDIAPQLVGEVARAVLGGSAYPQALFGAVVRRVRADAEMNHARAAILKAFLVRNRKSEVAMALDKDSPDQAYQLGRLFAALEKTQEDAGGRELNRTIKDRYFGAASATPASIFPMLLRLHQHHMNKIENTGLRVNREKLMSEICGRISRFPLHLPLEQQGLFYIAYYHQRQDFFTRKADGGKEMSNNA
jgi:CRISPR-associated protein Csd1